MGKENGREKQQPRKVSEQKAGKTAKLLEAQWLAELHHANERGGHRNSPAS